MANMTRATIYLKPELHKALKMFAALDGKSMSDVANEALETALREDIEDIRAFDERSGGPTESLETVVAALKADGRL